MGIARENQCDIRCPVKLFRDARFRIESADASLVRKAILAAGVTAGGLKDVNRSYNCPQTRASAEEWEPAPACRGEVVQATAERQTQLPLASLTQVESEVLGPILYPKEPPAIEGSTS
jgi:hypothetical protein